MSANLFQIGSEDASRDLLAHGQRYVEDLGSSRAQHHQRGAEVAQLLVEGTDLGGDLLLTWR